MPQRSPRRAPEILASLVGAICLVLTPPSLVAQTADPGFKLTLSLGQFPASNKDDWNALNIVYTNTSHKIDHEVQCAVFGGAYHLVVIYNGVLVPETEAARKERVAYATGNCDFLSGPMARSLKPGQSRANHLYWNTKEPGTYEYTVELDSDPLHPERSITVKSNSITVVVPPKGGNK